VRVTVVVSGRVHPHFQVVTPVWQSMPNNHRDRVSKMEAAGERLKRFHEFAS